MAGEVSAGAAPYPKPNAQYRVAFLSPDTVRSGSRADSAWSTAAAGEILLHEAATFHIGRGKKYGAKKG